VFNEYIFRRSFDLKYQNLNLIIGALKDAPVKVLWSLPVPEAGVIGRIIEGNFFIAVIFEFKCEVLLKIMKKNTNS